MSDLKYYDALKWINEARQFYAGGDDVEATIVSEIERLNARLEKEYERGDKNAQDAVNAQLTVNALQARVAALEGARDAVTQHVEKHKRIAGSGDGMFIEGLESAARVMKAATEQEGET